ncbi:hypothetical protein BDQ17DRAFT_1320925 [Cyathus striatus]|nr:hypothetical protein BDQ17DRAFT_1320925 [Cyathus striatus]
MLGASISAIFASIVWIWERTRYAEEERDFLWTYTITLTLIKNKPFSTNRLTEFTLVYALYNKRLAMTILLVLLFVGWTFSSALSLVVFFPQTTFSATCEQSTIQTEAFYFIAKTNRYRFTQIGIQIIFVSLTIGRTSSLKRALRRQHTIRRAITPLLRRLTRDSWVMLAFAAASVVSTIFWPMDARFLYKYNVIEMTFPLLLSAGGCRLIFLIRRIAPAQNPVPNDVAELDSTWNTSIELEDLQTDSGA